MCRPHHSEVTAPNSTHGNCCCSTCASTPAAVKRLHPSPGPLPSRSQLQHTWGVSRQLHLGALHGRRKKQPARCHIPPPPCARMQPTDLNPTKKPSCKYQYQLLRTWGKRPCRLCDVPARCCCNTGTSTPPGVTNQRLAPFPQRTDTSCCTPGVCVPAGLCEVRAQAHRPLSHTPPLACAVHRPHEQPWDHDRTPSRSPPLDYWHQLLRTWGMRPCRLVQGPCQMRRPA